VSYAPVSCLPGSYITYSANTTTEECPESDIDLSNKGQSSQAYFPGLALEIEGITTLEDDQIEQWAKTTYDHMIAYFNSNPDVGLLDVISEIIYRYFNGTETRNAITVTYSHSLSWRSADSDLTVDEAMAQQPFAPGNAGDYITSLNEAGILATGVSINVVDNVSSNEMGDGSNVTNGTIDEIEPDDESGSIAPAVSIVVVDDISSNETGDGLNITNGTIDETEPDDESGSSYPPCNICGEGKSLGNPEGQPVDTNGNLMQKCYELEAVASSGSISPEDCEAFPSLVDTACNCTEAAAAAEPEEDTTKKSATAPLGSFRLFCVILGVAMSFSI